MGCVSFHVIAFILLGIWATVPETEAVYVPLGIWRYIPYGDSSYDEFLATFTDRNNCTGQLGSWYPTIMDFKALDKEAACIRGEKYMECSKNAKAIELPEDFKTIVRILARNNARLTQFACEHYDEIKQGFDDGAIRCGSMTLAEAETIMSFYSHEILSYHVNRLSSGSFDQNLEEAGQSFHNAMKTHFPDDVCTEDAIKLRDEVLKLVVYS